MSAVTGIVRFDGAPVEPGSVERMTRAMAHRGPDGIRHRLEGGDAFGQCLLCTTPESLEERTPLANEDASLVLMLDGRVDNLDELRHALVQRGARLRDRSDAELVLRAYEAWGEQCPDRIIGEFVFVLRDRRQGSVFAARDVAGTRLLHYHVERGRFAFASEIAGLLALGIEPRLNESRVFDYLVNEFDRDDEVGTFYRGIERLPAGHALRVDARGVKTWRYWDPASLQPPRYASLDECAEALREKLRLVVACRLRSNGPVGAMLSGGLDSSSIAGVVRKDLAHLLREPLRTYSLVREDRDSCHDWKGVRAMLADGGFEPTILTSALGREACAQAMRRVGDFDEPFALYEGFVDALVFQAARRDGCRVILDGMAGDLLFYAPGRGALFHARMLARLTDVVAAKCRHGADYELLAVARRAVASFVPESIRALYRPLRDRFARLDGDARMLHAATARRLLAQRRALRCGRACGAPRADDRLDHCRTFTSGMLSFAHEVSGQAALGRGVEPRSPLSDRRMIEFAVGLPSAAKQFEPWYKLVLRKSMAGVLPEEVRWRRNVAGHPGWIFHRELIAAIASSAPQMWSLATLERKLGFWVDASRLRRAWARYARDADYETGLGLFAMVILAHWLEARFPETTPETSAKG